MKQRTSVLFILLLVAPLVILAWLGQRTLSQDRIVSEHQAQELAESRLREAQTLVHNFVRDLQQSSVSTLSLLQIQADISTENIRLIREAVSADPFLEQIFVLDADRRLQFPQDSETYSNREREFAKSLDVLLDDENVFRQRAVREDSKASVNNIRRDRSGLYGFDRASKIKKAIDSVKDNPGDERLAQLGWTSWDTGTTTDTYLWYRTTNGILIGQKLSSAYWLSQLIARLPAAGAANGLAAVLENASIRLVSKRQQVIYQWGDYKSDLDNEASPVAREWLNYPLDGWRLEYFAPRQSAGDINALIFILSFISIVLMVAVGGWVMWREYQRDVRNAEQRVNFVNQVSHELKTPLTNICIYADMLEAEVMQDNTADKQRVKKFTEVVTSESKRLGRLINNVLNFSRAQQQKITVHKRPASVDEVIRSTIDHFTAAFDNKDIVIETLLNNDAPVMLDAEVLEQVLNNLLSNIEKYAADGGLAQIRSEIDGELTSIILSDAGSGISQALRKRIFEPFERGSDSITEGVSGTGIGLGIARDLCRLHGGDLQLMNSDSGACFKATLRTEEAL